MTYPINVNIPNAPNDPADDQPIMKQNFGNISGFLSVDHIPPGTIGDGYHKYVHLKNIAAPGIGGVDSVFFSNTDGTQALPFFQNAIRTIQLAGTTTASSNNGQAFIPGGIILKWGFVTSTANTGNVTFVPAFPNNLYNVQLTSMTSSSTNHANGMYSDDGTIFFDKTGFKWYQADRATSQTGFMWFAIGN